MPSRVAPRQSPPRGEKYWVKAVGDREAAIKRLEAELRKHEEKPSGKKLLDIPAWVGGQLQDLRRAPQEPTPPG